MYRQVWLSILASMLIALFASLFAALMNARTYLEAQLSMKNQDNASALALALSQGDHDSDDVAVAASALFDGGHYELVQVVDPNGKPLVEKAHADIKNGAPAWFARLLPIQATPGQAEIANGWKPLGRVVLLSRAGFAYESLWHTALTMAGAIAAAGLLGGVLITLVLGRLRQPMRSVIEQARAINEHRFVTIAEPAVPELRELASAMNDTVKRLKERFEEDARLYEGLRRVANYDPLTGLANRTFFLANLENALESEDAEYGGLALIRVGRLAYLNRERGRAATDALLSRVGRAIDELGMHCSGGFAGRLNGTDFALLLPAGCDSADTLNEMLDETLRAAEASTGRDTLLFIGHGGLQRGENPAQLLARIDAALAAAEMTGVSGIAQARAEDVADLPDTAEAWRIALRQALDAGDRLKLAGHATRLLGETLTHRECPLRIRLAESGEWLSANRFLPQAERLGLIQDLDLATLDLALAEIAANPLVGGVWVNLSARSIADPGFMWQLRARLEAHPEERRRLWLEVPESGGLRRIAALRALARDLKPLGVRVGLEHYGHRFDQVSQLYDLGLDFLKVDSGFIRAIHLNPGNQAFLGGLCDIAHQIGARVVAEGVETIEELEALEKLGFDGVTGIAVREG
jgi:predicted signal transduction protein with EAL and GGDEF domain